MIIDRIFSMLPFEGIKEKCGSTMSRLLYILVCVPFCLALLAVALFLLSIILWLASIAIYKIYHFFNVFTL